MKYWLLTTEFPPFYGGGISTYCEQTCAMLKAAGHDVTVFLPYYESDSIQETNEQHARVIRFNPSGAPTSKFLGYEANLSFVFAEIVLRQIAKEGKPDVIESQEYLGIAYYLLQKKHLNYPLLENVKVVLTLHAPTFLYFDFNQVPLYKHPNFWTGEMERFCIRAADVCISPSAYLVEAITDKVELSDLTITVVPNPFEADYLEQPVPEYQHHEIIFYGKLIPQKGCIELLQYFSELWEEGMKIPLRLIGGGHHLFHPLNMDLGEYLKNKYKKYAERGLLILEGEITPNELSQKLSKAHIIIIPSIVDNLPYTVLEAMALGKVVLASKQGGQREVIIHGTNGFLFDHPEKGSFKRSLKEILALPKEAILEMGRRAKSTIRDGFSHRTIARHKLALLSTELTTGRYTNFPLIRPNGTDQISPFTPSNNLLTVVIPYFNMGKYVQETIQSIKASAYKPIHILLVNDGSTDHESLAVLKEYEQDDQIEIVHKANEGLARARNTGALLATGDFLAFLDPDDTVEPDYYLKGVQLLSEKRNISFVGCWARYFGESQDIWPTFNPEPPYVLLHNCLNTSALIYKRSPFLDSGLNDPTMVYGMEDYESMISMLAKGYRGVAFPEPWWNYRIRKNSMAQAFTQNSKLYLYRLIAEKHAPFYGEYGASLFLLLNSNGPSLNIDNPTLNQGIYSKFAGSKLGQFLIRKVKRNKYLRPVVIKLYKKFVN
jgi:glycosyltransferase involved in cell wall biosynthesis